MLMSPLTTNFEKWLSKMMRMSTMHQLWRQVQHQLLPDNRSHSLRRSTTTRHYTAQLLHWLLDRRLLIWLCITARDNWYSSMSYQCLIGHLRVSIRLSVKSGAKCFLEALQRVELVNTTRRGNMNRKKTTHILASNTHYLRCSDKVHLADIYLALPDRVVSIDVQGERGVLTTPV